MALSIDFTTFFEDEEDAVTKKTLKDTTIDKLKNIEFTPKHWKVFVGELFDGTKVYIVDGEYVRNDVIPDADFIGGGHYYCYPKYIPENEIWVEYMKNQDDIACIGVHEIFEYMRMKYFKDKYEKAHEKANNVEKIIRLLKHTIGVTEEGI